MCAIASENVEHQSLSRHVGSANINSVIRKTERFFQKQKLPLLNYEKAIIEIIGWSGKNSIKYRPYQVEIWQKES